MCADDEDRVLRPASDLARLVEEHADETVHQLEIPARRLPLIPIHMQASMHEARVALAGSGVDALFVRRPIAPLSYRTCGVLLRLDVESSYTLRR